MRVNLELLKTAFKKIASVLSFSFLIALFAGFYILGLFQGFKLGEESAFRKSNAFLQNLLNSKTRSSTVNPKTPTPEAPPERVERLPTWGGPALWEAVNKRRIELGVNPLSSRSELCTIASIRLNELLELGKLDGHEGFSNLSERRPDLKWIFEEYANVSEFLATGGVTPQETVSLWENTLGHKKLLDGGEYVWGCIYAQNTFAVAIAVF